MKDVYVLKEQHMNRIMEISKDVEEREKQEMDEPSNDEDFLLEREASKREVEYHNEMN